MLIGEMFVRLAADASAVFSGTQEAQRTLNRFATNATTTTRTLSNRTSADVNRIGNAFLALIPQITGVNSAFARLVAVLGQFAVGGGIVAGAVAGITAIVLVYKKLTEDAREAKKANDELIASLVKSAQSASAGNLPKMRDELERLEAQLAAARAEQDRFDRANLSAATATIRTMMGIEERQKAVHDLTTAVNQQRIAVKQAEAAWNALVFQGPLQDMTPERAKPAILDTSVLDDINKTWTELGSAIRVANENFKLFSDGNAFLEAQLAASQAALQNLLRLGVDPMSQGVQRLVEQIRRLGVGLQDLPQRFPSLPTIGVSRPVLRAGGLRPEEPSLLSRLGPTLDAISEPFKALGQTAKGLALSLGPFALLAAALSDSFGELFRNVAPIISVLAQALMPILKAMFPIIKLMAIAFTYVGQVFFNIAGGILFAVGNLIKGLGKFLDALPFVGDFGLISAGQAMIDTGKGFFEAANELAEARDTIRGLEWEDALDPLTEAANKTAEALLNVPEGFKVTLARFNATVGTPAGEAAIGGDGLGSVVFNRDVHFHGVQDIAELSRTVRQAARRGGAVPLRPAYGV